MKLHNSFFALALFLLSATSTSFAQNIPLNSTLPPHLAGYQNKTCFVSGFTQTTAVDITSGLAYPILSDLEKACQISQNDIPFNPRLFTSDLARSYYYCAQNQSLMILDSNISITQRQINLAELPVFHEVKMKTFPSHPDLLVFLGLVNAPNNLDQGAKNYTDSYMITIGWESDSVSDIIKLKGVHQEPIVDFDAVSSDKMVVVGEKVYSCGGKMNTYYLGKWGDSVFDEVVDFYIASSFGFVPQIKVTADWEYLVYANSQSVFVYEFKTSSITRSLDVTLVSNNYTVNEETIMHWEQVPFTVTKGGEEIYIFYNGNLDKYAIPDLSDKIEGELIPVQVPVLNSTYSRFFFFEDEGQDKALIQLDNSSFIISLSDGANYTGYDVLYM